MIPLAIVAAGDQPVAGVSGPPRAAIISDRWIPDADSLAVWRYSANFLYTLTINKVPHFLRVAPEGERTPDRLLREVALLDWLHARGWQVPVAIPTRDGTRVATMTVSCQTYHAVLWPVVPGVERELDDLSLEGLATWGRTLGQLHAVLRQVPAGVGPDRVAWRHERSLIDAAFLAWPPTLQDAARRSLAWIETRPTTGNDYGLIHGDFELDNLLWDGAVLSVIDFDEAGLSWAASDIAFAVRDLVAAGESITSPRLAAFLAGYAEARPLSSDLATELPQFSQWASLVTLARIRRARASDPSDLPAWASDLDRRLGEFEISYRDQILAAAEVLPAE